MGARDPEAIRRRVLERIAAEAGHDMSIYYTVRAAGGQPEKTGAIVLGAGPDVRAAVFDRCRAMPEVSFELADLRHPSARERTDFLEDGALFGPAWRASAFVQQIFAPIGMLHQHRLVVYEGRRFVAWIGGLRAPRERAFGARERIRLSAWVPAVQAALVAADRMERDALPDGPADLVVLPDGEVSHASSRGQAWLEQPELRDRIRRAVRAFDAGRDELACVVGAGAAHIVRTVGDGGCRYLVHVTAAAALHLDALAGLTPAQRRVAELAAAGATDAETARALGLRPNSVKAHLRAVYERLGVATRLELARAVAAAEEDR